MKIKKGDNVILLAGKDKGKKGKVLRSFPKLNKIIVEDLNLVKRHSRPRKEGQKGEILTIAAPVHVSNVSLIVKTEKSSKTQKTAKLQKESVDSQKTVSQKTKTAKSKK